MNNNTGNVILFETSLGNFSVELNPEKAPKTSARIKELVESGFYNGLIFHRVIDGFVIQGGDPKGNGTGGSGTPIPDEFDNGLKHDKEGVLAMANSGRPNSQDSQFYITLAPLDFLDGKYTVFGQVISGMDVVRKIGKVKTGTGDKPVEDVKMLKVSVQ
jgi:cyclophilin family peptidyl-prolyl cis-trans isomerase